MAESTRHPSEPDDNPVIEKRKTRIQVIDLGGNPLDEYMFIDWLRGGRCRIVCQYNISQKTIEDPDTGNSQMWVFDEKSLVWTPPPFYTVDGVIVAIDTSSRADVEAYIADNSFEIMGYAKQISISW